MNYEEATEGMERALDALGWGDEVDGCSECGYDAEAGRELCNICFLEFHGPDNDKDLDPELHRDWSINVQLMKDAGRIC
jgi:hypothetical protein